MKIKNEINDILLPLIFSLLIVFEFIFSLRFLGVEKLFVQLFLIFDYVILFFVFLFVYTNMKRLSKYVLYIFFGFAVLNSLYLFNILGNYSLFIILTAFLGFISSMKVLSSSKRLKRGLKKMDLIKKELSEKIDQEVKIYRGSERIDKPELDIYDESEDSNSLRVNINVADLKDLTRIKYIGESRAKDIIKLRPYSSIDELIKVDGITKNRLRDIKEEGKAFVL
ncbi:MAG: ComEA family DNA-binding protein [Candidatus Woesearchaeota archaeon]